MSELDDCMEDELEKSVARARERIHQRHLRLHKQMLNPSVRAALLRKLTVVKWVRTGVAHRRRIVPERLSRLANGSTLQQSHYVKYAIPFTETCYYNILTGKSRVVRVEEPMRMGLVNPNFAGVNPSYQRGAK